MSHLKVASLSYPYKYFLAPYINIFCFTRESLHVKVGVNQQIFKIFESTLLKKHLFIKVAFNKIDFRTQLITFNFC